MARLYANENMPLPVIAELQRLGHDVLTTNASGQASKAIPDVEVLAFAIAENRVLLTLNRKHFIRLHRQQPGHTGMIVCTFDLDYVTLAQRIHVVLTTQPDLRGQLIRINRPG